MKTITIKTIFGERPVQAYIYGRFAAHGSENIWTVTHIATGYSLCTAMRQMKARSLAKALDAAWTDADITYTDFEPERTPHYEHFLDVAKPLVIAARKSYS